MIVRSAWSLDEPAAVMSWRYPVQADFPLPSEAINEALAAIYNDDRESLDHPYIFVARDERYRQVGVVVTDNEGVELTQADINAYYREIIPDHHLARVFAASTIPTSGVNIEGDRFAIRWPMPPGSIFPVDALNTLLAALYDVPCRPFIYPVFDRPDDDSQLRQVGLIVSPLRDLPGTPSENWRELRDAYRTIFSDDELAPHDVPWDTKEWSFDA